MNKPVIIGILVFAIASIGIFLISTQSRSTTPLPDAQTTQPESTSAVPESPQSVATAYTISQVSEHATEQDCWMAIEGKVYDVTAFIPSHPGGKAIIGGCGKDATVLFNERPTNGKGPHPAQARTLLQKYEIGVLVP